MLFPALPRLLFNPLALDKGDFSCYNLLKGGFMILLKLSTRCYPEFLHDVRKFYEMLGLNPTKYVIDNYEVYLTDNKYRHLGTMDSETFFDSWEDLATLEELIELKQGNLYLYKVSSYQQRWRAWNIYLNPVEDGVDKFKYCYESLYALGTYTFPEYLGDDMVIEGVLHLDNFC